MEEQENIGGDGGGMPPIDVNHRYYDQSGQPTPIIQTQPEVKSAPVEQDAIPTQDPPDKKLYDQLYKTQLYTKSYDDFKKQFNNPQAIDKLYGGLNSSELYTKPKEDFYNQFFSHLPSKEVSDANAFISDYLNSPKSNKAIDKLTGDRYYNEISKQRSVDVSGRDATNIQQPVPVRLTDQTLQDRGDYLSSMTTDNSLMRPVLSQAKRQNPADSKKIDQAMYVLDASKRAHSPSVVKYYSDQISSGKMQYDIDKKQLVKPVGTFDALMQGFKNHSDAIDEYDFLTSHSDDDIIKHLDDRSKDYDPDKPVYKATGTLPSVAEMTGSNASAMMKMSAGNVATKLAGSLAPELSLPLAAINTVGMGAGVEDFHHVSYANTLEETYRELKNQHPDVDSKVLLGEAKKQANASGALAMGQALIAGEVGSKLGKDTNFEPVRPRPGFVKALTDIGKTIGKNGANLLKDAAPDITAQTLISGGIKGIENIYRGKPVGEGVAESMGSNMLFMAGLASIHAPDVLLGKEARENLVDGYSKAPTDVLDNSLKKAIDLNIITPENAAKTKQEIEAHKAENAAMPDFKSGVTPEAATVLDHIKETGADPNSFNKKVLEKIGKDNGIEPEEDKELSSSDIIDQLQKKQNSIKTPKTFVDASDLLESAAPKLKGVYKEMYEKDPDGFLKFIADQSNGSETNRTELEQADGITKSLIDAAISKYPEHILSPKTETNGQETEAHAETEGQIENQDAGQQTASSEKLHHTVSWAEGKPKGSDVYDIANSGGKENGKDTFYSQDEINAHHKKYDDEYDKISEPIINKYKDQGLSEMDAFEKAQPEIIKATKHNTIERNRLISHNEALLKTVVSDEIDKSNISEGAKKDLKLYFNTETKNSFNTSATNSIKTAISKDGVKEIGRMISTKEHGDLDDLTIEKRESAINDGNKKANSLIKSILNSVKNKTKDNAIQEPSAGEVLQREPSSPTVEGGERGGVEQGQQGNVPTGKSTTKESETPGEEKIDELPFGKEDNIGIAHNLQEVRATDLKILPPERGEGITTQESLERGKKLIDDGTDPDEVVKSFNKTGKVSGDDMSVVRQKYNALSKATNEAFDNHGEGSQEYKAALKEERGWYENAVKPMQTEWHKIGMAQQGTTDIDTGSFASVSRAFEKHYGKEPNPEQVKQIKELTQKNKELTKKLSDTDAKLIEATNKALGEKEGKASIAQTGKAIADKIRKNAKLSRPGSFSAATPASLVWDGAVEVVAQAVEKGALLADAISQGIEHIKQSNWYKGLSDDKKLNAENEFTDWHNNQATDSIASKFIDKNGLKFTNDEAKEIWQYAKDNYLRKGVSFRDMIENVANDTGLSFEQVSSAITTPKNKPISEERWKQQYDLRKNQQATERYIQKQGENKAIRTFKGIVNGIREESVFGHGGVFVGTHAGMTLTDLPRARHTIRAFFNAYKLAYGKTANYERAMENLKSSDNYVLAQKAGLQNNPDFINNDAEVISSKFGKLSDSGKKGFNAIKILRQTLFDKHYNARTAVERQDPGTAVSIARLVNNATGATNLKLPNWFKEVSFAGGMEAARWGKLTRNPIEATSTAVKTLFNPKSASIEDRVFAKVWARRVGAQLGTYAGLMATNAAMQNYFNDGKNDVNWKDPTKSDWMKMKIGNTTFDFTSGMLSTLHFAEETLYHQPFGINKSKDDIHTREFKTVGKYALGKLSPAYADAGELLMKHDYSGNTMPWSDEKPIHKYNHKMTWPEYVASKSPLPVAEGFNAYFESANQHGADNTYLDNVFTGIKDGILSGTTGFRAYDTPEKKEEKSEKVTIPTNYK